MLKNYRTTLKIYISGLMKFNSKKFEILRYGDKTIKEETMYFSPDDEIIEEKDNLRDLGIQMNNKADFENHTENVCQKVKQKSGWILRTFRCRKPYFMKTLWKQLVQPHIDYCSTLYMPVTGTNLQNIEILQQHFTRRVSSVRESNYWERLKLLQMSSQQRRLERYRIIYIWKILEGKVPNCGINFKLHERLGRKCEIRPLKPSAAKFRTLRENSFQVHGCRLFNILPQKIRSLEKCSVEDFKYELDQYLATIPDEPNVPGTEYCPRATCQITGRPSNSLIDQVQKVNNGGGLLGG